MTAITKIEWDETAKRSIWSVSDGVCTHYAVGGDDITDPRQVADIYASTYDGLSREIGIEVRRKGQTVAEYLMAPDPEASPCLSFDADEAKSQAIIVG